MPADGRGRNQSLSELAQPYELTGIECADSNSQNLALRKFDGAVGMSVGGPEQVGGRGYAAAGSGDGFFETRLGAPAVSFTRKTCTLP